MFFGSGWVVSYFLLRALWHNMMPKMVSVAHAMPIDHTHGRSMSRDQLKLLVVRNKICWIVNDSR